MTTMCRDLNFDDVKDFVDRKFGSAFDVLAAVATRGKEILEQHLHAMETRRVEGKKIVLVAKSGVRIRIHDGGKASPPPAVAEQHLAKRVLKKRSYDDGGEASTSISPPKKRTKKYVNINMINLNLRPPLPERFDMLIREMARGKNLTTTTPKLVIQKRLFETDLTKGHNRLSIPIRLISDDFLTEEEKRHVRARDVTGKKKFMQVTMIEPSLATDTVELRQWDMTKGNGGRTSYLYVINGSWYEIAMRNELKVKMEVQLWCFRLGRDLCFALVRPPMQMLSF